MITVGRLPWLAHTIQRHTPVKDGTVPSSEVRGTARSERHYSHKHSRESSLTGATRNARNFASHASAQNTKDSGPALRCGLDTSSHTSNPSHLGASFPKACHVPTQHTLTLSHTSMIVMSSTSRLSQALLPARPSTLMPVVLVALRCFDLRLTLSDAECTPHCEFDHMLTSHATSTISSSVRRLYRHL